MDSIDYPFPDLPPNPHTGAADAYHHAVGLIICIATRIESTINQELRHLSSSRPLAQFAVSRAGKGMTERLNALRILLHERLTPEAGNGNESNWLEVVDAALDKAQHWIDDRNFLAHAELGILAASPQDGFKSIATKCGKNKKDDSPRRVYEFKVSELRSVALAGFDLDSALHHIFFALSPREVPAPAEPDGRMQLQLRMPKLADLPAWKRVNDGRPTEDQWLENYAQQWNEPHPR